MEIQAVNRFVSTLAGASRSFYIYNQDNKAFDEILQNLSKRFQDLSSTSERLELTITNRSLLFEGHPVGFQEITAPLAGLLRNLGYKAIRFQAPIQSRQFFQLLHHLTGKESNEAKNEKLIPFLDNDEPKAISLVPMTVNSYFLNLSDENIARRLAPLPVATDLAIVNLPDLYVWILGRSEYLPAALKNFVQNLVSATQQGYFPAERFLKLFPLPEKLRQKLLGLVSTPDIKPLREMTPLGHAFKKTSISRFNPGTPTDWVSKSSSFSEQEIKLHRESRSGGGMPSISQDLDLAAALIKEPGGNFTLGAALLMRSLSEKNPVGIQEKALHHAIELWLSSMGPDADARAMSFLSTLRHHLVSINSIGLVLFPLRSVTIESSLFSDMGRYLLSLGKACLPALVNLLGTEQDRSMRKKICQLITSAAREDGAEILIQSLPSATPFLMRNLVMILGDIKASQAVTELIPLARHPQKIVRTEAIRTLGKIGGAQANTALANIAQNSTDDDLRKIAHDSIA